MNASSLRRPLAILLALCAFGVARAAAPTLIPFQGRVTDQAGNAPTNAQYTLIFNLYDQAVGGNVLWTETHQQVGVIDGTVNVFLGAINPTLATNNFTEARFLGITVDPDNNRATPDPEMVPRQMILPTHWSKGADNAVKLAGQDWSTLLNTGNNPATGFLKGAKIEAQGVTAAQIRNATITSNQVAARSIAANNLAAASITTNELAKAVLDLLVPPGSIMAFGGHTNAIPDGWLLCDGRAVSSNDLPRLYAAISTNWGAGYTFNGTTWVITNANQNFNLPDLRGYFLRGVDGGVGRDPDALVRKVLGFGGSTGDLVGSTQGDELHSHFHTETRWIDAGNDASRSTPVGDGVGRLETADTGATGGSETRPKNAYVHYIIKY